MNLKRVEGRLCGLCGGDGSFMPRSHIIPRAIGEILQGDRAALLGVPTTRYSYPRWVRGYGLVDRIVCGSCEASFKPADDYFIDFYKRSDRAPRTSFGTPAGWFTYVDADPIRLQRFFLTCLLRAHLSTDHAFARIDVGPFLSGLQAALLAEPAYVPAFPVYMTRETHALARQISVSIGRDEDGARTYKIQSIHVAGVVTVSNRPPADAVAHLCLRPDRPVRAVDVDVVPRGMVDGTNEARAIHGIKLGDAARAITRASPRRN